MNFLGKLCNLFIKFIFILICILVLLLFSIQIVNIISEKYFEYITHCKIMKNGSLFRGYNPYTKTLICEGISDRGDSASVDGYNNSEIVDNYLIIKTYGIFSGKYENWCFSKVPQFFIYDINKKYMSRIQSSEVNDLKEIYHNRIKRDFFRQDINYLENKNFKNQIDCEQK